MKFLIAVALFVLAVAQGPFGPDSEEDGPDFGPGGPGGRGFSGGRGGRGGKGGKGRGHHMEPPFLKGQNETVRREFYNIMRKDNETIQEQKQEIQTWAVKWNLSEQVNQFETNMTQFKQQLAQNVSTLIASLPSVQTQLEAIFNNESQTRQQMWEAIRQLKNQSRQAVDVLFFIAGTFKPHHRGGRPDGPFGGMDGGRGGPMGGMDPMEGMGGLQNFGMGGMGGRGQQGGFGGQGSRGQQGGRGSQFGGNSVQGGF